MLANAILDCLLHHSYVIKMIGSSYRTKDYYDLLSADEKNRLIKTTFLLWNFKHFDIDTYMLGRYFNTSPLCGENRIIQRQT